MPTNISLKRYLSLIMIVTFLACGTGLHADEFEGTYRGGIDGKTPNQLYVVKKVDADKYTVSTNDWVATAYYDKQEDIYKGVFRYKDFPSKPGNEFTKGGSRENAVGFHLYKITEKGDIEITFQWGRSAYGGQGNFILQRVK